MAVGWGVVGKHVDKEHRGGPASFSKTQIGSYQSVVKKGVHPFCVTEQVTVGDQN